MAEVEDNQPEKVLEAEEVGAGEPEKRAEVQPMLTIRRASAAIVTQGGGEAAGTAAAAASRRVLSTGERVRGKIMQLNAEMALVFLEEPHVEAVIDLAELHDESGILRLGIGDLLDAYVIEMGARGITLSRELPERFQHLAKLRKAQEEGSLVEGLVLTAKKTGLEVAVEQIRAFCPISQVDLIPPENAESLIGEKLLFHVMKMKGQQRVLLSRRTVLEAALKEKAEALRKELEEGKIVKGVVTHLREFGAFIDIGGLEGLVPLVELTYQRIEHPSELLNPGDELEVKVLKIEPPTPPETKERITLSVKQCQADPWAEAAPQLRVGAEYTGKVVRMAPFGAFVELFPGVDGLLHVSELGPRRLGHPKEVLSQGQALQVVLEAFSVEERRASLRLVESTAGMAFPSFSSLTQEAQAEPPPSPPEPKEADEEGSLLIVREPRVFQPKEPKPTELAREAQPREPRLRVGELIKSTIERIESSGLFVRFGEKQGFIPSNETATERGSDLKRAFQLGQEVQAEVLSSAPGEWRLSIAKAQKTEERKTLESFRQQQKNTVGFGTLADKLKNLKIE